VKETKIFRVDPLNPDTKILKFAARAIKEGKLVIFPTETVYGIGANALDENAVRKIFIAKNRPPDNPLIAHVSSISMTKKIVSDFPQKAERLIKHFWPGPLTIIFKKSEIVPDIMTAGLDSLGVRMPAHPVALKLIEFSGTPLAAPSANISGKPSATSAEHAIDDFMGKVDIILDAGESSIGIESTILNLYSKPPMILRPGPIPKEDLERILGEKVEYHPALQAQTKEEALEIPSIKYAHYVPDVELIFIEGKRDCFLKNCTKLYKAFLAEGKRVQFLVSEETAKVLKSILEPPPKCIITGMSHDFPTIAHNLFQLLREIDPKKVDIVIAESYEPKGLGYSINFRLRKGATRVIYCP